MVEDDGPPGLPGGEIPAHHGGFRREQWGTDPAMEVGVAKVGGRKRVEAACAPLAARNEQVEQDRAPPVFLHQPELARSSPNELGSNCESHCRDQNKIGT